MGATANRWLLGLLLSHHAFFAMYWQPSSKVCPLAHLQLAALRAHHAFHLEAPYGIPRAGTGLI
jgi:hypothetical protein